MWRYVTFIPWWGWAAAVGGFLLLWFAHDKRVPAAATQKPRYTPEWLVAFVIWSILLFPLLQALVTKPFRLPHGAEGRAELALAYLASGGLAALVAFIGNKWGRIKPVGELTDTHSERG